MAFADLREFIAALEEIGEIRTVEGADWDLEIGTISELNYERRGPALLFDRIKDYPPGYRILTNSLDNMRRSLLALGMPLDLDMDSAAERLNKLINSYEPVPPVEVTDAPILENVYFGDEVDLWKFPTPRWHEGDGECRYLGTGCAVIMRDPDTGVASFGTYRVMVHDKTTAGLYISPPHTGAHIEQKYWQRGQSCPVAVTMGHDPIVFLGASANLGRRGRAKTFDLLGHARGAPVEIIREEVTGLPIPATAEIVIAGEVPPPEVETRPEGPFGEWTGYYASGTRPEPIIHVRALYHRNNPIILGMPPVKFRGATSHFGIPMSAVSQKSKLQRTGVEDVLDVWRLSTPGVTVVQIRQRYPGHAMKAALAASGEYMGRFVVVVDEDINPRDPDDVLWAIGTRCDPETSITIIRGCESSALDPRIPPDRKAGGDFTSSRAIINACKPYDWIKEFPPTNVASPELRAQVLAKWKDLL